MFDPVGSEQESDTDTMMGYLDPSATGALLESQFAPGTALLAADCRNGRVNQWRRDDFNINAESGPRTRIHGYVLYKRISCAHWRIMQLRMWMTKEPIRQVYFRYFGYTEVYRPMGGGSDYVWQESAKFCEEMNYGTSTRWDPLWIIKARGFAIVEVVDEHHIYQGAYLSCDDPGGGTSYLAGNEKRSGGFRLPGGTR